MNDVVLKKAELSELVKIQQLAHKIWHQHYIEIIGINQVNYMLNKMYSSASINEQIMEKQHEFYFVLLNSDAVGFISISNINETTVMIHKFYIDQTQANKGLGSKAFALLLKIISAKKIQLTVNRENYKSINFYFKSGFKIIKVENFDIGEGYVMNDFVMEYDNNKI